MKKFSFCFTFLPENIVLKLKQPQCCPDKCSNSSIISITDFIVKHIPKFTAPKVWNPQPQTQCQEVKQEIGYDFFEQQWNNFLIDIFLEGSSVFYENTHFVEIAMNKTIGEAFDQSFLYEDVFLRYENVFAKDISQQQRISNIFSIPIIYKSSKKVGLFIAETYSRSMPKLNRAALFLGNLYQNESWHIFSVVDGQIPTFQQLMTFDCIILPGSSASVLSKSPFIKIGLENVMRAYKNNKKLKLIGVCYGHQLIAQYFQSSVINKKFIKGIEKIIIDKDIVKRYYFLAALENIQNLYQTQLHEDYVQEIPEGFQLLGRSESCKVESLVSKDGRILTTQFHSEYFCRFLQHFEAKRYNHFKQFPRYYYQSSAQIQELNFQHSKLFLGIFRKFMSSETV